MLQADPKSHLRGVLEGGRYGRGQQHDYEVKIHKVSYANDETNGPAYDRECSNRGEAAPGTYPYHRWQLRVRRPNGLAFVDQWEPILPNTGGQSLVWVRNLLGPEAVSEDGSFDETLLEGMECGFVILSPKAGSNFNGRVTQVFGL